MDTNEYEFTKNLFTLITFVTQSYRCGLVVNPESCQTRMQFIVATHNTHKTREVEQILESGVTVRDLTAYPEISEIAETGTSFEENAKLKALAISRKLPGLVIADDSGLEVEALGGAPGIHSARYAGTNASDKEKIAKLLRQLATVDAKSDQRRARFRCALAVARDGQILATIEGVVEGKIAERPRGSQGFGYDPVFIPDGFKETFAELPEQLKNKISHRAKALRKLQAELPPLRGEV
jgi:XTP/dITP diphosphohydrolase